MENEFIQRLSRFLPLDEDARRQLFSGIVVKEIASGTVLLSEGETADRLFLVIKGCLRGYFIKENGTEITSQFFIENQMVSSFESAMTGTPSRMFIETIEDSVVGAIPIKNLNETINNHSTAREYFSRYIMARLIYYMNQHASFILDTPEKRYRRFIKENPELVSRLPLQYIASYLGITPVSLSRIRSRLKKQAAPP